MNANRSRGITLMELMVVMLIVGVLAAVAYPSYRRQAIRAQRAEAKVALEQAAQALERCFTRAHSYESCDPPASANPTLRYTISFGEDEPTPTTYLLQAEPSGGQTEDPCGTLTLNQQGVRGQASGQTTATCW